MPQENWTDQDMHCPCGGRLGGTGSSVRWCDKCGYHEHAAKKIFELESLVKGFRTENDIFRTENNHLKTTVNSLMKQVENMFGENADLAKTLETIRIEYERLNQEYQFMTVSNGRLDKVVKELQDARMEIKALTEENFKLAAGSCDELVCGEYGNPTCILKEENDHIKRALDFYLRYRPKRDGHD